MIAYLTQLARSVDKLGIGYLLVADISMPRGGRFTSGHASHQTGLDADIWLRLPNAPLNVEQAADPKPYPVVDIENYRFKKDKWTTNHELLLQVAAVDERVARLFVHPLIKKQLCDADWKDRGWLRKVRPWWGHYYHFHVRLHCPKGEPKCIAQSPPPQGEGCGKDLASWQPDSRALNKPADKATQKAPLRKRIAKPKFQECIALLAESQGGGY
jgi:penicillin-insensitive murein endopeptidase